MKYSAAWKGACEVPVMIKLVGYIVTEKTAVGEPMMAAYKVIFDDDGIPWQNISVNIRFNNNGFLTCNAIASNGH